MSKASVKNIRLGSSILTVCDLALSNIHEGGWMNRSESLESFDFSKQPVLCELEKRDPDIFPTI